RAGSPAGADLGQFLAAAVVGSSPGTRAAESAAVRPEARRTARTPRDVPYPAAGRTGGRGRAGRAGALPALWTAVSRSHRPPSGSGLAAPGGGAVAAGRAGDRVPDGRAALWGRWEAHPRGS